MGGWRAPASHCVGRHVMKKYGKMQVFWLKNREESKDDECVHVFPSRLFSCVRIGTKPKPKCLLWGSKQLQLPSCSFPKLKTCTWFTLLSVSKNLTFCKYYFQNVKYLRTFFFFFYQDEALLSFFLCLVLFYRKCITTESILYLKLALKMRKLQFLVLKWF